MWCRMSQVCRHQINGHTPWIVHRDLCRRTWYRLWGSFDYCGFDLAYGIQRWFDELAAFIVLLFMWPVACAMGTKWQAKSLTALAREMGATIIHAPQESTR